MTSNKQSEQLSLAEVALRRASGRIHEGIQNPLVDTTISSEGQRSVRSISREAASNITGRFKNVHKTHPQCVDSQCVDVQCSFHRTAEDSCRSVVIASVVLNRKLEYESDGLTAANLK